MKKIIGIFLCVIFRVIASLTWLGIILTLIHGYAFQNGKKVAIEPYMYHYMIFGLIYASLFWWWSNKWKTGWLQWLREIKTPNSDNVKKNIQAFLLVTVLSVFAAGAINSMTRRVVGSGGKTIFVLQPSFYIIFGVSYALSLRWWFTTHGSGLLRGIRAFHLTRKIVIMFLRMIILIMACAAGLYIIVTLVREFFTRHGVKVMAVSPMYIYLVFGITFAPLLWKGRKQPEVKPNSDNPNIVNETSKIND